MLKLIASVNLSFSDVDLSLDKNRKKSLNMILAIKAMETLLAKLPEELKSGFDLILTSGEGEIGQTYEFFKNLAENRPRPTLFMNSLHNSTLGALSLEIPGIVSGMTISNGDLSFEYGLEAALSSLGERPIIIMGIDAYNPEMLKVREELSEHKIKFHTGATVGFFLPEKHASFHNHPGMVIKDLKYSQNKPQNQVSDFYPANGLTFISKKIFEYTKPSGTHIQVILHD